MYGCQYAIDQEKKKGRECKSNPLTGSTIRKSSIVDEDGKVVWEQDENGKVVWKQISACSKLHNNAN